MFEHVTSAPGTSWAELDQSDPAMLAGVARLRRDCATAKEALSADTDVRIPVALPGIDTDVRITRLEFEEMIRLEIEETARTLLRVVGSAGVTSEELTTVLLTGGSARIPLVTQLISGHLDRPVTRAVEPQGGQADGAVLAAGDLGPALAGPGAEWARTQISFPAAHVADLHTATVARPPLQVVPPVPIAPPFTKAKRAKGAIGAAATAIVGLAVTGGIILANRQGPRDADADVDPVGSTSSAVTTTVTTTAPNVTTAPTSTERETPAGRRRTDRPYTSTSERVVEPPETSTTAPETVTSASTPPPSTAWPSEASPAPSESATPWDGRP